MDLFIVSASKKYLTSKKIEYVPHGKTQRCFDCEKQICF